MGGWTDSCSVSRFLSRQRARPLPAPGRALFFGPGATRPLSFGAAAKAAATYRGRPLVAPALWRSREPSAVIPPMAHDHAHGHAPSADADSRRLGAALALILAFMAAEVVAAIVADSLALLSDAGHMLTD